MLTDPMLTAFHYANISVKLRPHSRYPIEKFPMLRDGIVLEGLVNESQLFEGRAVEPELLERTLTREYVHAIASGSIDAKALREIGFLWSEGLYERSRRIVGCTLDAAQKAKTNGISVVLGGGAHHGHHDHGRGFCVFNDLAICANELLRAGEAQVAVFDCDVHQGDGTAAILRDEPRAFTCSVHAESNFPFRKERSDLDIGLPDDCSDQAYLDACKRGLEFCLELDDVSFLLYVAGADPYKEDKLGRLSIEKETLAERDRMVFSACNELELPVVVTFGGGYCEPIDKTAQLYYQTIGIAKEFCGKSATQEISG